MIHHVWHTGLSFLNFCWLFEILEVMPSSLIPVTRVNQDQLQSVILENAKTSGKSKGTKWQPCRSVEENRSDSCQQVKSPFLKFLQGTVRFFDLSVKEPDYPKFPQGTVRFPYLSVGEPDQPPKEASKADISRCLRQSFQQTLPGCTPSSPSPSSCPSSPSTPSGRPRAMGIQCSPFSCYWFSAWHWCVREGFGKRTDFTRCFSWIAYSIPRTFVRKRIKSGLQGVYQVATCGHFCCQRNDLRLFWGLGRWCWCKHLKEQRQSFASQVFGKRRQRVVPLLYQPEEKPDSQVFHLLLSKT